MERAEGSRPRAGDRLLLLGLGTLSAALFGSTWTAAIQVVDGGELVAAACNAGVAHPPGYPLYTLLGNLLCRLPLSTAAGRVGLLSVLAGVCAVLAVFGIVRHLTGSRWGAMIAALVLATGSLFWRHASLAEVFALHVALCLGALYAAARAATSTTARGRCGWLGLAALALGLALSNERTSALLLPLLGLPLLWPHDGVPRLLLRLAALALGLALGLAPYLYLLAADPFALPRWGDETGQLAGLVHHVLRHDYGAPSSIGAATPLAACGAFFAALPRQLGWVLALASLLGVVLLVARAAGRPPAPGVALPRPLAAALVVAPLLTGPLMLLFCDIPVEGAGRPFIERYFLLPIALFALALGVGLAWLEGRLLAALDRSRRTLWRGAAFGVVALAAMASHGRADVSEAHAVEDHARNALFSAERGALILGQGVVRRGSFIHAQRVLGLRKDVQYIDVPLLRQRWYVRQQRWLYPGFAYGHDSRRVAVLGLIKRELLRGRAVYLAGECTRRVRGAFGTYPVGPLWRVVDPEREAPTLGAILALNERLFRGFRRRGLAPDPQIDPWSAALREPFAEAWLSLGRRLRQVGALQQAQAAFRRGLLWAPWLPPPDSPSSRPRFR